MTEGEENIIIKGVLLEAISRDFSEELSNNKEVSVSPRFKRQMMAMMNNPNKWAERHKRDYRRRFVKVVTSCKKYSPNVRLYHIQTALGEYFF